MNRVLLEIKERSLLVPSHQPFIQLDESPPSHPHSSGFSLNNNVSPSILLIIIILAIIFFISGLLHLLVRFLLRPPNRDPDEMDSVTALQGQLQQLFHLHDAGVDQSFIDTLPVFNYKAIIGVKDPFDCAVCLCEFEGEDKLRLLPKCSHAFHMDCIDTWLLSHSTCPLCRASLLQDFSSNGGNCLSPIVFVLESGSGESSREILADGNNNGSSVARVNSHLSGCCDGDLVVKSGEIKEDEGLKVNVGSGEKVVSVKLGKFRSVDGGGGEGCSDGNSNVDARRCFSMGSFAYVMDENSSLQVPIRTPMKKEKSSKKGLMLGNRQAMSECGGDSRREFNGFEGYGYNKRLEIGGSGCSVNGNDGKSIGGGSRKKESFSVSKIWLRGKKEDSKRSGASIGSSRRAFSFRFPVHRSANVSEELKEKNGDVGQRTISEFDRGSVMSYCEDTQSCNSLDSQATTHSVARRTLQWLMGRQNKVVHSSFTSNV